MAQELEDKLSMAKLAERAERYDDMADAMKSYATASPVLRAEDRNLLSVAFKNSVGARRSAWRVLLNIEENHCDPGSQKQEIAKEYRGAVESELRKICDEVLKLLDDHLIPSATSPLDPDSAVFYWKMKGDYIRYVAEISSQDDLQTVMDKAEEAYEKAMEIASENLKVTHPIRLGLALNFSVFYYEIRDLKEKACSLAKKAFDDAIVDLPDTLREDSDKDSTLIMQLLRDNLTLWTSEAELPKDNGEGESGDD